MFTKTAQDLEQYIPADSLPSLITGDASKPSFDERATGGVPKPGRLPVPSDEPNVEAYWKHVSEYEKRTIEWAKSENDDAL